MISPGAKELLSQMHTTPYARALREYLETEIEQLNDVSTAETWEETLGRKYTVKALRKLFYFIDEKAALDTPKKNQYI